jgi:hypothetical protein
VQIPRLDKERGCRGINCHGKTETRNIMRRSKGLQSGCNRWQKDFTHASDPGALAGAAFGDSAGIQGYNQPAR